MWNFGIPTDFGQALIMIKARQVTLHVNKTDF